MKKKLWLMVFALGLTLLLVGCGQKFIKSGDTDSKYDYGWIVNKDNTVTIRVKGKWEKDCIWQAECDESLLHCEPQKKKGSFLVNSYSAGVGDLYLRLYPQGQEEWEYTLKFSLHGNGTGGVNVMSSTHEEPVKEGSYTVFSTENAAILVINTSHLWQWHDMGDDLRVDILGASDGTQQFSLTAKNAPAQNVTAEFYDTQSSTVLTVTANIAWDGTVNVTDIQESDESHYIEKSLELLWEKLGYSVSIPNKVTVLSADIYNGELFAVGDLNVNINGNKYQLYLSLRPDIVDQSIPRDVTNPVTGEVSAVSVTEKVITLEDVKLYQKESHITAIWKHLGCYYVLEGHGTDVATMEEAVAALMGG